MKSKIYPRSNYNNVANCEFNEGEKWPRGIWYSLKRKTYNSSFLWQTKKQTLILYSIFSKSKKGKNFSNIFLMSSFYIKVHTLFVECFLFQSIFLMPSSSRSKLMILVFFSMKSISRIFFQYLKWQSVHSTFDKIHTHIWYRSKQHIKFQNLTSCLFTHRWRALGMKMQVSN